MNIIEAIKSGKKFRRKNKGAWFFNGEVYSYTTDSILADDWEVESQPVTITRKDLDKAWAKARSNMLVDIEVLAKELGL